MKRRRGLLAALLVFACIVLITASPALMFLAIQLPLPWGELGDAGQAYGAASALLSGLALLGVVVSLVIQQRQNRMAEEQTVRQRHFDLIRLTLDDMKFLDSWGFSPKVDYDPALIGFSNLILTYWLMLWRIGHVEEKTLRSNARGLFAGQVGRDHWRRANPTWPAISRLDREFVAIINEEYDRSTEAGPPTVIPPKRRAKSPGRRPPPATRYALYGALAGSVIGGFLARHKRLGGRCVRPESTVNNVRRASRSHRL